MVRRLEADQEQGYTAVARAGDEALGGVQEPAVRWIQAGLAERTSGLDAPLERLESNGRGRAPPWARLDADPRFRDDAQDPLGADEQPIRGRAGARGRHAAGLEAPAGRDHAEGLDRVVDARLQGGVVAAGPRGDPASNGGELERLRIVAKRQAAGAQGVLQGWAEHAGLHPR